MRMGSNLDETPIDGSNAQCYRGHMKNKLALAVSCFVSLTPTLGFSDSHLCKVLRAGDYVRARQMIREDDLAKNGGGAQGLLWHVTGINYKDTCWSKSEASYDTKDVEDTYLTLALKGSINPGPYFKVSNLKKVTHERDGLLLLVHDLVEHGVDVNQPTTGESSQQRISFSPMRLAILGCNVEIASVIANSDFNMNATFFSEPHNVYTEQFQYIHDAVKRGCLSIADLLLQRGANPNALTNLGNPVLKFSQDADAVNLLVQQGANTHVKVQSGKWLLEDVLLTWVPTEVPKALLAQGETFDASWSKETKDCLLYEAVALSDLGLVTSLVNSGVSVNGGYSHCYLKYFGGREDYHTNPYCAAVEMKFPVIAQFLESKGASTACQFKDFVTGGAPSGF